MMIKYFKTSKLFPAHQNKILPKLYLQVLYKTIPSLELNKIR